MNVLFVEDDRILTCMWVQRVKKLGAIVTGIHAVFVAHTELDAVRILSQESIDVLFLDGTITQKSGPWDTQEILRHALAHNVFVIAISSQHNDNICAHGGHKSWDKYAVYSNLQNGVLRTTTELV